MEVYVLVMYMQQPEFTDSYGEQAAECSAVIGIYDSWDKAEAARAKEVERDAEDSADFGCDPCEFVIHCMIVQ